MYFLKIYLYYINNILNLVSSTKNSFSISMNLIILITNQIFFELTRKVCVSALFHLHPYYWKRDLTRCIGSLTNRSVGDTERVSKQMLRAISGGIIVHILCQELNWTNLLWQQIGNYTLILCTNMSFNPRFCYAYITNFA